MSLGKISIAFRKGHLILLCVYTLAFMGCRSTHEPSLKVAVASNLTEPLNEIVEQYEKDSGKQVDLIIGSSGKITAQISHGAPYDLFLSADMNYLNTLKQNGLLYSTPDTLAEGTLIVWSSDTTAITSLEFLIHTDVKKIALPNPETAPFGRAARQALERLNLWDELEGKLVYGESVTQTNQFLFTGAVDAGITSKSILYSSMLENKGQGVEVERKLYDPILHGIGIISTSKNLKECFHFTEHLGSKESQSIFSEYGYRLVE